MRVRKVKKGNEGENNDRACNKISSDVEDQARGSMNIQDISGQTPDSLKKKKQLTYLLCRSVVCLVNMSPYPIFLSTRETDIYVIVPDLRHVVSQQQPLFVGIA